MKEKFIGQNGRLNETSQAIFGVDTVWQRNDTLRFKFNLEHTAGAGGTKPGYFQAASATASDPPSRKRRSPHRPDAAFLPLHHGPHQLRGPCLSSTRGTIWSQLSLRRLKPFSAPDIASPRATSPTIERSDKTLLESLRPSPIFRSPADSDDTWCRYIFRIRLLHIFTDL